MVWSDTLGLREFLREQPRMAVRPAARSGLVLKGQFEFTGQSAQHGELRDAFQLAIVIPHGYPRELPVVTETGGRIPRNGDFHVNPDGSLCLGSPLGLLLKASRNPTLSGYVKKCVVPYLFAVSYKLQHGGPMLFGELAHGTPGELQDYVDLFSLKRPDQAKRALEMLGMKKRRANKLPCPCGCGKRLGKCRFNYRITEFRKLASRVWFREQWADHRARDGKV